MLLLGCYYVVIMLLLGCYYVVIIVLLLCCYCDVIMLLLWCYYVVIMWVLCCYYVVIVLLLYCYGVIIVMLLLVCCYYCVVIVFFETSKNNIVPLNYSSWKLNISQFNIQPFKVFQMLYVKSCRRIHKHINIFVVVQSTMAPSLLLFSVCVFLIASIFIRVYKHTFQSELQ